MTAGSKTALVTRMLNDMGGNPDQLPLMQHILMLLCARPGCEPGTICRN